MQKNKFNGDGGKYQIEWGDDHNEEVFRKAQRF